MTTTETQGRIEPAQVKNTPAVVEHLSKEKIELLKRTICKGGTDDELELFLMVAKRTGLDPFTKQIYAIKRWNTDLNREEMSHQVGIDGFRLVAQRTGEYEGQEGPYWCGADGKWVEAWLLPSQPVAAKIGVWRRGHKVPMWGIARFQSYCQTKKDGSPTRMWQKMGDVMLAKCAEALALRKAFPNELSGVYTPEEMSQAEKDVTDSVPTKTTRRAPQPSFETPKRASLRGRYAQLVRDRDIPEDFLISTAKRHFPKARKIDDLSDLQLETFINILGEAVPLKSTKAQPAPDHSGPPVDASPEQQPDDPGLFPFELEGKE